MSVDSSRLSGLTSPKVFLVTLALGVALGAGTWAAARSPVEPLLALLGLGVLVTIARNPRVWLVLVVVLSAFRSYDNVLAGGFLSWSKLLTLAMLVVYGVRLATGRARVHLFRDWLAPLLLLMAWGTASLLWAFDRDLALMKLVSWVSLFILQALIYSLFRDDLRAVEAAIYAHIAAMTIFAWIGLSIMFLVGDPDLVRAVSGWAEFGTPLGRNIGRFFGFFADANATALLLGYAILLALVMANAPGSRQAFVSARPLLLLSVWPMLFALVCTFSRTGLVAFLGGLAYLAYRLKSRSSTALLAAVGGTVYLLREGIVARFAELPDTGWGTRLWELKLGLQQFMEAPITGIGMLSFRPKMLAMGIRVYRGDTPVIHNNYLRFLVELGLPGLLLALWFCAVLIKRYRKNARLVDKITSPRLYWMNLGFGACFLSSAIFALPLGLDDLNQLWVFFGLFAIVSGAVERRREELVSRSGLRDQEGCSHAQGTGPLAHHQSRPGAVLRGAQIPPRRFWASRRRSRPPL